MFRGYLNPFLWHREVTMSNNSNVGKEETWYKKGKFAKLPSSSLPLGTSYKYLIKQAKGIWSFHVFFNSSTFNSRVTILVAHRVKLAIWPCGSNRAKIRIRKYWNCRTIYNAVWFPKLIHGDGIVQRETQKTPGSLGVVMWTFTYSLAH